MRLVHRSLAVGIAAAGILAATSGSALGATIDVFDGGSIQAAVKSAHRGDAIVVIRASTARASRSRRTA